MDPIVLAALKKWPNVPACRGWLGLDARGDWYMRDDRVQAAGPFPQSKGSRITHDKLREFIQRNYMADEAGCWYFQNGPQQVYVELEAAPWVWRIHGSSTAATLQSHTGLTTELVAAYTDEAGRLFLHTDLGFGLVHSMDMHLAIAPIESGAWRVQDMLFADMPGHFGYRCSPAAFQAQSAR
ncbi:MAG: DUF2946 family protein [Burkholderiaceae bacterium]